MADYQTYPRILYYESSSVSPFSASMFQAPKVVRENENFYISYGLGTAAYAGAPAIADEDRYPPNTPTYLGTPVEDPMNITIDINAIEQGYRETAFGVDQQPTLLVGAASATISRGQIYTDVYSITNAGIYNIIIREDPFQFPFKISTTEYPIVVLPATGSRDILIAYTSGSGIYIKEYFRDVMYNNFEVDVAAGQFTSITVQNFGNKVQAPITPGTVSASYTCNTSVTGSLVGFFSGTLIGRVVGNISGTINNQYITQYYADPFSGSFSGILTGSMCGMFSGSGRMTASAFDAGVTAIVSASINGQAASAYSGTILGGISGTIVGQACCNRTTETERLTLHNFSKLSDDRLRLYYSKKNPITQAYTMSFIETVPLI